MTLDYRLHGDETAPPLVLSNSLGTTHALWDAQLPALAARFQVLAYDHPGHGVSDLPTQPCTVSELARELLRLLDVLELGRVSICGVSLGAMVAMTMALEAPDRVDRLVLACTSAHFGPPDPWLERARTVRSDGMEAVADAIVGRWFTPALARTDPQTVARFREMLASTPPEGYARCCEAVGGWDARDAIAAIAAPTLVVAGGEDPAAPIEHAELIASRISGARLRVIEGAAHLANVERPAAFTNAALEHLGQEVAA